MRRRQERSAHSYRSPPRPTPPTRRLALARPLDAVLGAALRRVARENPAVFDRLGAYGEAAFLIVPAGCPLAFRLEPAAGAGAVTSVRPDDPRPVAATIRGPLVDLVSLFAGVYDADAAFFARRIEIAGDTGAVVALHNALEAADLGVADLLGAPKRLRPPLNAGLAALLNLARMRTTGGA